MKIKAFTLTELLVALGIIGAIAALSLPSLIKDINKKVLSSQIKNTVASLQQLVTDQMVTKRTKSLQDTDFGNPSALMSSTHFETSGSSVTWPQYRTIADLTTTSSPDNDLVSVKLKNGVVIGYKLDDETVDGETVIGKFCIDINGKEDPNIAGRDYFTMYLTKTGRIIGYSASDNSCKEEASLDTAASACFHTLMGNNWKMDY